MIFSVEKRKKRVNGILKLSRCFYLRYRFGDMPSDKWVSLGVTDKSVAHSEAKKFILEKEREYAGLALPRKQVEARSIPVTKLLAEFIEEMKARRRDSKYIAVTEARVSKVVKDARWRKLSDVSADSFLAWRRANGHLVAKTRNDYLASVNGFIDWLVKLDRLGSNPLAKIGKVQEKGDEKRKRRAFTPDEFKRLCAVSGRHKLVYLTAAYTGLRRNELAELQWGDIQKTEEGMQLTLRAAVTKNRLASNMPVHHCLAAEIDSIRPSAYRPTDKVFPHMPRIERFRLDLKAAKVDYKDDRGRFADFHALRYTFATFLTVSETGQRVTQELMRHSAPEMTSNLYTDAAQLPLRAAIENLPWIGDTQIGAQISAKSGHSVSQAGERKPGFKKTKPAHNKRVSRVLSHAGDKGQMVAGVGFEPTTFRI